MWKLIVAFIVFAVIALFVLKKSGGNIDMGGEKHDVSAPAHSTPPAEPAASPVVPAAPASAASS